MFKKRNVSKEQIRKVQSDNLEESNPRIYEETHFQGSLNTDIDEIKKRNQLKKDSDLVKDPNFEKDEKLDELISIVSHKSNRKFSHDNIINNYDLDLHEPNPPNKETSKTIYSRRKYETLESRNPNIKLTLRMDYQHDICKDFKETGYCGFGDTCKFLHDRSDFKSGWQLDREWDKEQKRKRLKINPTFKGNSNHEDGNLLSESTNSNQPPKKCFICKKKWRSDSNPIVTLCNHYFCEKCALNHYVNTSKCFQCSLPTKGTFNIASIPQDLISKSDSHDSSESESLSSDNLSQS
ncbi:ZF-CCCH zinc finger domain-containing protein [Cryptosporidium ubiquitum]|uniref:ZF-CCCH zinc finger domain-containing protein n=1 Tax=Cryptosporidium ubiquitum TaxID=857276 RepID=A0A1J4MJN8_9CRYT|nr:ZF-CCCH zinc finger domain-containing protein [Cryptosporidium ubiquitum]OII73228.1 ZF-CCCH zinc finger domain-containing protein [Cryptosporidium ubiquitum]